MDVTVKVIMVVCVIVGVTLLGYGFWKRIGHGWLEKQRLLQYKRGYQQAVNDVLNEGHYIDQETNRTKSISVAVVDGEITPYWEERYDEYTMKGFNLSMDSFVKCGAINKRTAEKLKRRFTAERERKKNDKN